MSTVKFTILTDRKNKTGRYPIALRITTGNYRKYVLTGYHCLKDEWDEETETVTSNYSLKTPSRSFINAYLTKYKTKVQDVHDQLVKDGISDYSPDQFLNIYGEKIKVRKTVFKTFSSRIDELNESGRVGYASVFKNVLGVFKTYRKNQDLFLRDLTPYVLNDWVTYLKNERDVTDITINNYLRTTRTLYLYAIKKGWVRRETYPFHEFKVSEFGTETSPRALNNDKLEELLNKKVFPDLQLARDIFVFSFFGRGISFIDIALLTEKNIQDGLIIYERKKMAKKPVRVVFPIRSEILDIINRYKNLERGYLLPILNKNIHKTEKQKLDRISKVRKKVNRDLKILGKQSGVEGLTTYWARHSYASYMFRKGMPVMMIKESLRHKNLKTTEIYLKSLGLDAISNFEDDVYSNM
jgi:site-specific recombinase XerD